MTGALGSALADAPHAGERALREAERAITRRSNITRMSDSERPLPGRIARMGVARVGTKWVYDFAEGSKEMRNLLGGKGANVAEMTRILGADRVPAGFTITTEACVSYMENGQTPRRGWPARSTRRSSAWRRRPARRSAIPTIRCSSPCARARASRCPACSTRSSTSASTTSPSRASPRRPATSASRGTPTGASCRCSATSCATSPASASSTRSPRRRSATASRSTPSSTSTRCKELTARFREIFKEETGEEFPQEPRDQLEQAIRAVFDSWTRRPRRRLPAHQPHPRRLGHGGQRPADGVRQQGRHVGLRRRVQPRRGRRRPRAVRATSSSTPRARTSSPACATRRTSPTCATSCPRRTRR